MKKLDEMIQKYPQYADAIMDAYVAVITDPDRDLEAELDGLDIEEKDIWDLTGAIVKELYC